MTRRTLTDEELHELREYYDTHSTADEIEKGTYDDTKVTAPMITYAVRMPASVLDQLRDIAQARGVTVSALMRQWLEERLLSDPDGQQDKGAVQVSELLAFIAERRVVDS